MYLPSPETYDYPFGVFIIENINKTHKMVSKEICRVYPLQLLIAFDTPSQKQSGLVEADPASSGSGEALKPSRVLSLLGQLVILLEIILAV
jgi:hypothetical protein